MIYLSFIAYNKIPVVERALNRILELLPDTEKYYLLFTDPQYPLNPPHDMYFVFEKYRNKFQNISYFSIKNDGVAGNYNQIRLHFQFKDDDKIICFDPDSNPRSNTFLKSMCDVLDDSTIAMCILRRGDFDDIDLRSPIMINGHSCFVCYRGHSWPMWAFNGKFLMQNTVKQKNKQFGFIEDEFHKTATEQNLKCVILENEKDDMIDGTGAGLGGQDELYLQWQSESALCSTGLSFESWLEKRFAIN